MFLEFPGCKKHGSFLICPGNMMDNGVSLRVPSCAQTSIHVNTLWERKTSQSHDAPDTQYYSLEEIRFPNLHAITARPYAKTKRKSVKGGSLPDAVVSHHFGYALRHFVPPKGTRSRVRSGTRGCFARKYLLLVDVASRLLPPTGTLRVFRRGEILPPEART